MSSSARDRLVNLLVSTYPDLKRRLAARLGSVELAGDVLQDTYIRLRRTENLEEVNNPGSYLFRMAINIASNRTRAEALRLSAADIETLTHIADDAPDPLQSAEARSELAAVQRALSGLPERRRDIFLRAWVDERTHEEIGEEFGISVRTVRHELLTATRYLHEQTQSFSVRALQLRLAQVSSQ